MTFTKQNVEQGYFESDIIEVATTNRYKDNVATVAEIFYVFSTENRIEDHMEYRIEVKSESEKAYEISFIAVDNDEEDEEYREETKKVWIPKSQAAITDDGYELPEWIVSSKKIRRYGVKKKYISEEGGPNIREVYLESL